MGVHYIYFLLVLLAVVLYWLAKRNAKSSVGRTIYKSTGIHTEYLSIDLEKGHVTGRVSYQGKVYMLVYVDVAADTVKVKGSIQDLIHLTDNMKEEDYIEVIRTTAKFYIENGINNPDVYYEAQAKSN
ncbi:uncharacterized protein (DUF58 family) [Bacillus tianshenii]|uniref:Uncharacterized protein (DUF58 family) n=1 Tax=Sutcliffiella tianshenii TaxID=1463404 RepID=A0ABS2NYT4_9BACI|nr:hypothetical protein [Bacillus tianshenii]MBM7619789.1 uncharacterized protein (DUF58 family) [Bacillus tianshenii]